MVSTTQGMPRQNRMENCKPCNYITPLKLKTLMESTTNKDEQNKISEEVEFPSCSSLEGRELMTWTAKAMPQITPMIETILSSIILIPLSMLLYGHFGTHEYGLKNPFAFFGAAGSCLWLFFWRVVFLQKTVYHYRVTDQGIEEKYYLHYPKHFRSFFKGFAIVFLIVVLGLIAVDPVFIWMLAGPGGMAIMASKSLITWENKITYGYFTWDRPNWIFVDRKRNIIVIKRHHNPSIPTEENYLCFELYLLKGQLDKVLSIVKTYAPANIEYEEGNWSEKVEIADMRSHLQEQGSP